MLIIITHQIFEHLGEVLGVGDPAWHGLLLHHEAPGDACADVLGQDPGVVLGPGA